MTLSTRIGLSLKWIVQRQAGMSALSVALSVGILACFIVIFGESPLIVISALFEGALRGANAFIATVEEMAVLILTGLAILLPIKGGYFNIGCQGQLEAGALAAVIVATNAKGPAIFVILLSMAASMAAGVLVGSIPLILRVKRGASEVTTAIMLNYVVTNFCCAMFYGPFQDPGAFYGTTRKIPEQFRLSDVLNGFHCGVIIALALAVGLYFLMNRTVFGTQLYATGYNRIAAQTAGLPVNKIFNSAVLFGAAIGGLAGGIEVMGVVHQVAQSWAMNWGFIGVCVAFLGGSALGIIPITLLLSIIATGGRFMQAMTGVPEALVSIMQGLPVMLFLIFLAIRHRSRLLDIRKIWQSSGSKVPAGER